MLLNSGHCNNRSFKMLLIAISVSAAISVVTDTRIMSMGLNNYSQSNLSNTVRLEAVMSPHLQAL